MSEIDYNRTSSTGLANFTADYLPSSSFVTVTAVPEPGTLVRAGLGAAILAFAARRRRGAELRDRGFSSVCRPRYP